MKRLTVATLVISWFLPLTIPGAQSPQISAGYNTSFCIQSDGSLWSWGQAAYGMLGRGGLLNSPVPGRVGTNLWRTVAGGNQHVLAIQQDGTLWAWGNNGRGQLGIGSSGAGTEQSRPLLVSPQTNWAALAAGPDLSLALRNDGTLWAWGWNAFGAFGDGTTRNSDRPLQIRTNTDWSTIAAAGHVLALRRDGTLWSWGDNTVGQLGDGTTASRTRPKQIGTNQTWKAVAAGNGHSLAIDSVGELWAWGLGQFGELGTGDVRNRYVPTRIGTDTNWLSVLTGASAVHSLGFKTDGSMWGWGLNTAGQFGRATNLALLTNIVPTLLAIQGWARAAANNNYTVALRADHTIWTTGNNSAGQLGDGTFDARYSFAPVIPTLQDDFTTTDEATAIAINVLGNDSDASASALTLRATSPPRHGQMQILADGQILYLPNPGYYGPESIVYSAEDTAGAVAFARVEIDVRRNQALNHAPRPEADFASTDPGISVDIDVLRNDRDPEGDLLSIHTFTQAASGTVAAAGPTLLRYTPNSGFQGQDSFSYSVEDPSGAAASAIVQVYVGRARPKLVAGGYRTMLLRPDGTIWAWGANEYGQLGTGNTNDLTTPTQVGTDRDWRDLDGDWEFTVARKANGSLWSWGANYFGQLGNRTTNNSSVPVQMGLDHDWATFAVSRWHTVALKKDATLWSWGMNYQGALGTGRTGPALTPTRVGTDGDWTAVFAGVEFSLAKKIDGTLWGWGYNQIGQLADGTFVDHPLPVRVRSETSWSTVFPANDFVLARQSDGSLWGWGENSFGQLSAGVMKADDRFEPSKVGNPVRIGVASDWLCAAGGFSHALGIREDGTLWSWGTGTDGSLGLPIPGLAVAPTPTQIGLKTDWVAVSAGEAHSVAVDTSGGIWTWGNNGYGQLGLGTRGKNQYDSATSRKAPTLIQGFGVPGFSVMVRRDGRNISLSWPLAGHSLTLETATNIDGPWQPLTNTVASNQTNESLGATVLPVQATEFFRLHE